MDRRSLPRQLTYQEITMNCITCKSPDRLRGMLLNFSESGVLVEALHKFEPGHVLSVEDGMYGEKPRYGEIVWTGPSSGSNSKAGIRFIDEEALSHTTILESMV